MGAFRLCGGVDACHWDGLAAYKDDITKVRAVADAEKRYLCFLDYLWASGDRLPQRLVH